MKTNIFSKLNGFVFVVLFSFFSVNIFAAEKKIDYGVVKDSEFVNKYFGMTLKLPEDWTLESSGSRVDSLKSKDYKEILDSQYQETAALKIIPLILFSQYDDLAETDSNPTINIQAEKLEHLKGIKTTKQYLENKKKMLEKMRSLKYTVNPKFDSYVIGGKKFDVMYCEMNIDGEITKQNIYVTSLKDCILVFDLSFVHKKEEALLKNILKTVKFK